MKRKELDMTDEEIREAYESDPEMSIRVLSEKARCGWSTMQRRLAKLGVDAKSRQSSAAKRQRKWTDEEKREARREKEARRAWYFGRME